MSIASSPACGEQHAAVEAATEAEAIFWRDSTATSYVSMLAVDLYWANRVLASSSRQEAVTHWTSESTTSLTLADAACGN